MTSFDFDLLVIGAGSGGVRAARIAAGHGARVGLVEEHRVGGTCVIRGCVPKKLLHYGAHFAEDVLDAEKFGWSFGDPRFTWGKLRDAVAREAARLEGLYTETIASRDIALFKGHGRIVDPHRIDIDGQTVSAAHILIATGARPRPLGVPGEEHCITSNEVFGLETLPGHVAIVGGGYIANEFAGILHALGSKVTMINRTDTILRSYDASVRDRLLQISLARGIVYRFDARVTDVARNGDLLAIRFTDGEKIAVDQVIVATGRIPNIEGLGLADAGVGTDDHGAVLVDDRQTTSVPSIHAVGDVTNRIQLTPIAIREGHALADRLFGGVETMVSYEDVPSAVFSNPPIAAVGLTEAQARERYGTVRVYSSDFRPMRNVLAERKERALYKLVVDEATDRILGAHLIGPEAPEIAQTLAIAVKAGLTKAQLDDVVAIHPTMAEELVLLK